MFHLLRDGEIYTPEPMGRGHVLLCGEKVAWIGRDLPVLPAELGVEETDLAGAPVIPGLVDCHVHLTGGGGEAGFASRLGPMEPADLLRAGITSVVGVLGTDDTTRSTADLLAATRSLCGRGVSAWCLTGGYHVPPVTLTGSVRGDLIHIDRIVGVGEIAISDHRSSHPTTEELARIAGDAYVGGMLAGKAGVTHLHVGDGAAMLAPVREMLAHTEIPKRVIHPTHVNRNRALFREALELAGHGCPVDVTAFPAGEDGEAIDAADAVVQYLDAGLPGHLLTVSSDSGGSLPVYDGQGRLVGYGRQGPERLASLLAELVAAGRPLDGVAPLFTENPARVMGLAGKGSILAGADADLVILDGGYRVDGVISGGEWRVRHGKLVSESGP